MNLLLLREICFKTRSLGFSSTTALPSPSCSLNSNTIYFPRLPNPPGFTSAAFRPSVALLDSTGSRFSSRDLDARGNRLLVRRGQHGGERQVSWCSPMGSSCLRRVQDRVSYYVIRTAQPLRCTSLLFVLLFCENKQNPNHLYPVALVLLLRRHHLHHLDFCAEVVEVGIVDVGCLAVRLPVGAASPWRDFQWNNSKVESCTGHF